MILLAACRAAKAVGPAAVPKCLPKRAIQYACGSSGLLPARPPPGQTGPLFSDSYFPVLSGGEARPVLLELILPGLVRGRLGGVVAVHSRHFYLRTHHEAG